MAQAFDGVAARWPREQGPPRYLRLLVPEDAQAAQAFYATAQLVGQPEVPRTFPSLGLAVVPLPRDDRLLARLPSPPQTWLHGFRHECAHLLSLDRPALREAPRWFQEGFAELWCADDAGAHGTLHPLPDVWPRWGTYALYWPAQADPEFTWLDPSLPSEVAYSAFAAGVVSCLTGPAGQRPWEEGGLKMSGVDRPRLAFHGLRGRHAGWNPARTDFLLATLPGQQVDLDLPHTLAPEEARTYTLELGRSSAKPEAGLVWFGSDAHGAAETGVGAPRIRIRFGLGGGLAAYAEAGERARYQAYESPNDRNRLGRQRVLDLKIEGETLDIRSEDFQRSFDLAQLGLRLPLHPRMVVVDGAFRLQKR